MYMHLLYMYACRINFCQRYTSIGSMPHVRSKKLYFYQCKTFRLFNIMSAGLSLVYTVVMSQQCTLGLCCWCVSQSVVLVGDIYTLMLHLICSTSTMIPCTQGFKHGKNMYFSKTFESRHGPYNIDVHIVAI